jgi:uncharacterized protein YjbI with pentapeptide repeats
MLQRHLASLIALTLLAAGSGQIASTAPETASPTPPAPGRGSQLVGLTLTGANLPGADFHDTVLTDCVFGGDFSRSNFDGARLVNQNFSGMPTPVDGLFSSGDRRRYPAAILRGASFRRAEIQEARFWDADLRGADLSEADLTRTTFSGADLSGAKLAGANLMQARFDALGSPRDETQGLYQPGPARLRGADFSRAKLWSASLEHVDLRCANLRGASLNGANLTGADVRGADLRDDPDPTWVRYRRLGADWTNARHDSRTLVPVGFFFPDEETRTPTARRIVRLLSTLKPWGESRHFYRVDEDRYLQIARALSAVSPRELGRGLVLYENTCSWDDRSRVLLFLRVLFDLPEDAPRSRSEEGWYPVGTHGFRGYPGPHLFKTTNLAWPFSWKDGRPKLISSCEGGGGTAYSFVHEYAYLQEHFPRRKLPSE